MQCEHAQEFLSEYVFGDMDRALAVTLENHLSACKPCAEAVDGLRRLWVTLDEMPLVDPPASFHASLMERISRQETQATRPLTPLRLWKAVPALLAYAAAAVILLLGVEAVQVQRATLGPVGALLSIVRPVPPLQTQKADWMPNGQGGGVLTVTIQANKQVNGAASRHHFVLRLLRKSGTIIPGTKPSLTDGEVTSDQPTLLSVPLDFTPSEETDSLEITLTPADSSTQDGQTVSISLTPVR
jgi:hypothetical protein